MFCFHRNQDTNDRFMANIQRNGTFSVVPRVPAGEVSNLPSQCKRPVALTLSFRSRPRNSSSSVKSPRNVRNSSLRLILSHSTAFPSQQTTSTPKSQADNASTSSALKKPTCPPSGKSSPTRTSRADTRTARRSGP